jgi:RND family efflux transporter MFP subunit
VLPEIKLDFPEEFDTWQTYFNNCEFDKRIPDLPEVSNQKIKLFLSRFNVYKLYFQVSDLEIRLSKHYFYAPFDGSIVSTDLRVGSTARSGSRLGEIINLEDMEVEVPVPASEIAWIDRNKPVTFTSSELSGVWQGKIKRIGQNLDERTQAIQVYISVDKNGHPGLYNGAFLQAHIPGKPIKDAFIIPRRSIYSDKYVYLINEGKFDYREISIARDQTDSVIVNGGIQSGDTLVTDLLQGITPGMPAQIRLDKEQEDSQN